jgi:hypothetical protein
VIRVPRAGYPPGLYTPGVCPFRPVSEIGLRILSLGFGGILEPTSVDDILAMSTNTELFCTVKLVNCTFDQGGNTRQRMSVYDRTQTRSKLNPSQGTPRHRHRRRHHCCPAPDLILHRCLRQCAEPIATTWLTGNGPQAARIRSLIASSCTCASL